MLNNDDRRAIEGLFERLDEVERRSPPRDGDAEWLIDSRIRQQPHAPYYMAQTIVVQERALEEAAQRIKELEDQQRQPVYDARSERGPWDRAGERNDRYGDDRRGGGGFLAGAAQTAMGVAGGVLIGNMLGSLFGGSGAAQAAETPDQGAADNGAGNDDVGSDGFDDGGGFDGGFDMGGDF